MSIIKIPSPLQSYVEGQKSIILEGTTVSEVLLNMTNRYPAIKQQVFDPDGKLRAFINIFLGERNIKELKDGLDTKVRESDSLVIIASIAGG